MDIFKNDADFKFFLFRLKENLLPRPKAEDDPLQKSRGSSSTSTVTAHSQGRYIRKVFPLNSFTLVSYCLMPNHFHLLIRQNTALPISKLISKVCTSYSMYFNKKYGHVGGVFQDQYKAILVENDSYLFWLSAYIHQNPLVAEIVKSLENYSWSSYLDYIGKRNGKLVEKDFLLKMAGSQELYKQFVDDSFDKIKNKKDMKYLLLDA